MSNRCATCGRAWHADERDCPNCGKLREGLPEREPEVAPPATEVLDGPIVRYTGQVTLPDEDAPLQPISMSEAGRQLSDAVGISTATNGKAIAAFVFGLVGVFMLPVIGSLVAVIVGPQARREIRASGGAQSGDGLAIAGIVMGWVILALYGLVFALLMVGFFAAT